MVMVSLMDRSFVGTRLQVVLGISEITLYLSHCIYMELCTPTKFLRPGCSTVITQESLAQS